MSLRSSSAAAAAARPPTRLQQLLPAGRARSCPTLAHVPLPPRSWNAFGVDIDEEKVKAMADLMVELGLKDAG